MWLVGWEVELCRVCCVNIRVYSLLNIHCDVFLCLFSREGCAFCLVVINSVIFNHF